MPGPTPSHLARIETLFERLLDGTQSILSSSERAEVQGFIDQGEYGLALQTAFYIFLEGGRRVEPALTSLLAELAHAMSMSDEVIPFLDELRRRAMT
jgi:hypothetical protein